mgnify:CR=1 FL=1
MEKISKIFVFEKKLGYAWVGKKIKFQKKGYRYREKKEKGVDDPEKREKQGF